METKMKKFIFLLIFIISIVEVSANYTIHVGQTFKTPQNNITYVVTSAFTNVEIIKFNDTCISIDSYVYCMSVRINITPSVVTPPIVRISPPSGGGGAPGLQVSPTECKWNITPTDIFFNKNSLNIILNITNYGSFDAFIQVLKPTIPTLFGLKDLLEIERETFYIHSNENKTFNVKLSDISNIREDTEVFLEFKGGETCIKNVSINIKGAEHKIFYDVRIKTDHLFYTSGEIVNLIITITNLGDVPDTDTNLKLYVIDPAGKKDYFHEEKLYEVQVGTTELTREFPLDILAEKGKYEMGIEYETERQGVLKAFTSFRVIPLNRVITYSSILIIFVVGIISIVLFIIGKKRKEEEK